ncbi:MAG: hypothetical protein LZF62_340235 [Nitrospira sp.]|nr:MAG: hypothetical protein LZF62_340235 [Nitrospira sp.]
MSDQLPGLNLRRIERLMRNTMERCHLSLSGSIVLTEAASGAYVVTPVLAALAGAEHVYAVNCTTRYGSAEDIRNETIALAKRAGVDKRIEFIAKKSHEQVSQADIITNSGHVRPIDSETIGWMKPTAVIPLMYETWELRPSDVDVEACRQRGIAVAGTNERHPAIDVFSFLGPMAIKQLLDAGIAVYASRILLLCDNFFSPFIEKTLVSFGAEVDVRQQLANVPLGTRYDAILVALQPHSKPVLTLAEAYTIAASMPGAIVIQFWGDIEREFFHAADIMVWPPQAPPQGHMGILPSAIGPDPVIRLQCGGLKVAQVLLNGDATSAGQAFLQAL